MELSRQLEGVGFHLFKQSFRVVGLETLPRGFYFLVLGSVIREIVLYFLFDIF